MDMSRIACINGLHFIKDKINEFNSKCSIVEILENSQVEGNLLSSSKCRRWKINLLHAPQYNEQLLESITKLWNGTLSTTIQRDR
jgi:hypothetical protein